MAQAAFGDFAASWQATVPTPGSVNIALLGDMDADGIWGSDDIDLFVLGLNDPAAYESMFGVPATQRGDVDQDGDLDFDDIPHFVALLALR